MKKELVQNYTMRITQSNRTQLVVIIYEMILSYIDEAGEYYQKEELVEFQDSLKRAQRLIKELMEALDFQYAISGELLRLYLFLNRSILNAITTKKMDSLRGINKVIENLHQAFSVLSESDESEPLMMNAQKVYAGLTYGKTSLSQTCEIDQNRGFQA